MRATTYLSLLFVAAAGAAGAAVACANGGGDTSYAGGDDGGGSGDGAGGDGAGTMGDGGTQRADAAPDVFTCTPAGPPSDCTTAMNLGTLTPGQMLSATGNIATDGGEAFVAVTFTGNLTPTYHPQIELAEGGAEFAFEVLSDCTTGTVLTCADEDGAAADDAGTGSSTWEEFYTDAADFTNDTFVPIQPSGDDGGVVVRIYRRAGMPLSCNQYALTVSE